MSELFSPHLFVGREIELEELMDWTTARNVFRRLITLAAPPGYGKSWLLYELEKRLAGRRDLFIIRVPLLELRSRAEMLKWLLAILEQAKHVCSNVREAAPGDTLESIIFRLLEDLCQHCSPTVRPILVVDHFDEVQPNEREMLEKQLLEQFWRNLCVRIIIATRDEFGLSSFNLRRGEDRKYLSVFKPPEGQAQLEKRAASTDTPVLPPAEILPLIRPYQWTNPGLNTCLYEKARHRRLGQQNPLLTPDDLKNCWLKPIENRSNQVSVSLSVIESDLKAIISEETWTVETFAQICNYSRSMALNHIDCMMILGLLSSERQRYKVVDGLKELIRAEVGLRRGEMS